MIRLKRSPLHSGRTVRKSRWHASGFFRPIGEELEARTVLSGMQDYDSVAADWFQRVSPGILGYAPQSFIGPIAPAVGTSGGNWQSTADVAQWIVRLTPDATQQAGSVAGAESLLNGNSNAFHVLRGLGLPGLVLVEVNTSTEATRAALATNHSVATFEANAYFFTQATPNDPDLPSLTGLDNVGQFGATADADIDAREAWDVDTGSTNIVVGVVDSGIDYTHPDLYLNVWINQGEIPAALKSQVIDTDADGRITFYDLNNAANASRVSDLNNNAYIDAGDLYADPRWTDGVDTDRNAFVDDLFGWNFRSAADEPNAPNDPQDILGHGTHVAGTIGAIGNNGRGVTGINWRTSLMALKFLDTGNSGQTADAVAAIYYATMMREQFGEPIKVLNASWGQSGSESQALRDAIAAAGQTDMLLVAAAGNGNILGQGINLDRDPFFPASSDLGNVISVAASGVNDELARFSNFGSVAVDLAAPGIGVLSTLPGGRYGTANGTSMAAPHVAGVAALIWSELPFAASTEVRQAILTTVDGKPDFTTATSTNGRLNAQKAINSTVFAPRASLVSATQPIVTVAGGADNLITVRYHDRQGINDTTIGNGDIIATRQWGPADIITATYVANSKVISNGGTDVTAQYRIVAPGGSWDSLDFGGYALSVGVGQIESSIGQTVPSDAFGQFSVRIADPTVFYVNSSQDVSDANIGNGVCATAISDCTLRAAIQESNAAAPALRTIILDEGSFKLSIPPVPGVESVVPPTIGLASRITPTGPIVEMNGVAYFARTDATSGSELWRSDGTLSGTWMVKDIYPGVNGSAPSDLVNANGVLFLSANDGVVGRELWKSDGTSTGTVLVADYRIGSTGSNPVSITNVNGKVAFVADNGVNGLEVGWSDGTSAGTLSNDTRPGTAGSNPAELTSFQGQIYFRADDGTNGVELRRWSGPGLTVNPLVRNIAAGSASSFPTEMTVSGDSLFFTANEVGVSGNELWKIPPTALIKDIQTGTSSSNPVHVTAFLNGVIFAASDGVNGVEIWKSDGTIAGTVMIKDIFPGAFSSSPQDFFVAQGTVYFRAQDGVGGIELWKTDGTTNGTVRVKDIEPGAGSSFGFAPQFTNVNGTVYFVAATSTHGQELWKTDGSEAGTVLVQDIRPGPMSSNPRYLSHANGRLLFVADDGTNDVLRWTVAEVPSVFPDPQTLPGCYSGEGQFSGSNIQSGDYDIRGRISILGNTASSTRIDAAQLDRAFKVYPNASLSLSRVTVTGGKATHGAGVLSGGELDLNLTTFVDNSASLGGGVATVGGVTHINGSTFRANRANQGGGLLACNEALVDIAASTMTENFATATGSGLMSSFGREIRVTNSTISQNLSTRGSAIVGGLIENDTTDPEISTDGRFVAFVSNSSNLVEGDTNNARDIFVSNRENRTIERVNVTSDGRQSSSYSDAPTISGDGRYVAFSSADLTLVGGAVTGQQIYLFDRQTKVLERVSSNASGTAANNNSYLPSISDDGRWIAFYSDATNLVAGDTNGAPDIFIRDRTNGTVERIDLIAGFVGARPVISGDGRFVAFASSVATLVPGDTNGFSDIFVYDRQARTIERVSVNGAIQGNAASGGAPAISFDGRFVAFVSDASNLAAGDTADTADVFVFDRQTRTIERIGAGSGTALSADGRYVSVSLGVYDRQNRTLNPFGSSGSSLSGDGRYLVRKTEVIDLQQETIVSMTAGGSPIALESVTIADNIGRQTIDGSKRLHNSLFVRNQATSGVQGVLQTGESRGYNLLDKALNGLASTDLVVANAGAGVGPLQDNGGPTWTHALLFGGAAVDSADPLAYLQSDQRGVIRPYDGDLTLGARPDIGAHESHRASVQGTVFLDRDGDGQRDSNEMGLPGQVVFLDINNNGHLESGEPSDTTSLDDPATAAINEDGGYAFADLEAGTHVIGISTGPEWSQAIPRHIERVSVSATGIEANSGSYDSEGGKPAISADGRIVAFISSASNLVAGDTNGTSDVFVRDRVTGQIERVNVSSSGTQANSFSGIISISANGRWVAFFSNASNLVSGDTANTSDVFVFDRQTRTVERIGTGGTHPSISADGRFVAFSSLASNLVSGDTNGRRDIFVFDRQTQAVERVSINSGGTQGNNDSSWPAISANGRFVGFLSGSTNLVSGDGNNQTDVFVFDRSSRTIERINVSDAGIEGNNATFYPPSLSGDGRFVAFSTRSSNLVPQDANGSEDVFVYDRQNRTIELISVANDGVRANSESTEPRLSEDGRYVAFDSSASNLVTNDTNNSEDVFVFDRLTRTIEHMSVDVNGVQGNSRSEGSQISADGRWVEFISTSNSLVTGDANGTYDAFVTANRSAPGAGNRTSTLIAGQVATSIDFGIVPSEGQLAGRCFDDVIANGARDEGEPGRQNCSVYLDLNANSRFDAADISVQSATDGSFAFADLDSEREYRVGLIEVPAGQSLVLPSAQSNGIYKVYLPAGGTITDRDFGLRPASTVGQFENGLIQGRLYVDQSGATKPGLPGIEVFVDLDDDGVRDFNEPRMTTLPDNPNTPNLDESGQYSFAGLGNRPYTVRVLSTPANVVQSTPIGNSFTRKAYSLAVPERAIGTPQDVVVGDFNNDTWPDIATAIFDGNAVSILINDQQGGFLTAKDIPLAPASRPTNQARGTGPIALVAGQLNGVNGIDLAVANSYSSNVAILLDFNGTTFASERYVDVGLVPTSITAGDLLNPSGLGTDGHLDLIVTNSLANSTGTTKNVSLLRNSGQGIFTVAQQLSAGNYPSAVVVGNFNGDSQPDLAVTDYGTNPSGSDLGDIRVFLAQANGTFASSLVCRPTSGSGIQPGAGPTALISQDLNGDQKLDLAVTNFLTDNVTLCLGNGEGTFAFHTSLPGGSGPTDIAAVDIDGEGDVDLLVTNGKTQKVAILRNRLSQGSFGFEPAESFGAATFLGETRVSLVAANVDRQGGIDLIVANSQEKVVAVHRNALVGGAHRRALTGVETLTGVDFAFERVNLSPTLGAITSPPALNEDSPPITVNLSGISAGTGENQPLSVSITYDNPGLIASATPQYLSPAATGSVLLTLKPDQSGQATVTVTVTDGGLDGDLNTTGDNGSTSQTFSLTINPLNDSPTLNSLLALLLIDKNLATQTINLTGITAGGSETQPLRVTATTNNPAWIQNLAVQYPGTGTSAIVTYSTPSGSNTGQITITVIDGGLDNNLNTTGDNLAVSQTVALVTTNNPPTIALANTVASLAENTSTAAPIQVAEIQITDDGVGGQTLSLSGADARYFEIVGSQLFLAAGVVLDYETKLQYSVTVAVDDPTIGSTPDATATLTLNLTDVNEPPSVSLANPITSLPENTVSVTRRKVAEIVVSDDSLAGTIVLRLAGADANRFEIFNQGLYLVAGTILDYETRNHLQAQVIVDDTSIGGATDGLVDYSLSISDVNELPTLDSLSAILLVETSTSTHSINLTGISAGPGETQALQITATTNNSQWIQNLVVQYPGSGTTATVTYSTASPTGTGQITISVMDAGLDNSLATTGDNLTVSQTLALVTTNSPPSVALNNAVTTLPESTSTTAPIKVAEIQITDDGVGGQTLSLSGADARYFEIVGSQLFLAAGVVLDYETKLQYSVTVAVDDPTVGSTPDATATLTLNLTDANEPPTVSLSGQTTALPENTDLSLHLKVTDIVIHDDASGSNGLRLAGADANRFELVGQALYLVAGTGLDFETQNRLQVTVVVDDPALGDSIDASVDYVLSIADVNEQPTELFLSNSRISTLVDTSLSNVFVGKFLVVDEDRSTAGYAFSLVAGTGDADNSRFIINGSQLSLKQGTPLLPAGSSYSVRARLSDGPFILEQSFEILVTSALAINHAPSFLKGINPPGITDESGEVNLPGWATQISVGPGDSPLQNLEFLVTVDQPELFAVPPTVDSQGRLIFTPKANQVGTATVSVVLRDDGGTVSGGIDQSEPQTFAIAITKKRVWHNALIAQDVLPDKNVVPEDVVTIINYINAGRPDKVPIDGRGGGPYYDVTGDGSVAADDVLFVINKINSGNPLQAEGESASLPAGRESTSAVETIAPELLDLLATAVTKQTRRKL